MSISTSTPALAGLVAEGATVETVARGFTYTEGPVWDVADGSLLFNDIPADRRMRWHEDGRLEEVVSPTRKSNGMAFDLGGDLLVCESERHCVARWAADGTVTVIADRYEGLELNSPNDLAVHSSGDIYFTDPAYGRIPVYGIERPQQLGHQGVYRIRASDGELELLESDFVQPNGLCLSPDERTLYVNDTEVGHVLRFDVADGGTLSGGAPFHGPIGGGLSFDAALRNDLPLGLVDGMKCDERGNVYVTGPGGVWVIAPDGERIGVIELPEEVANFTWGGADGRSLLLCGRTTLMRVAMDVTMAGARR